MRASPRDTLADSTNWSLPPPPSIESMPAPPVNTSSCAEPISWSLPSPPPRTTVPKNEDASIILSPSSPTIIASEIPDKVSTTSSVGLAKLAVETIWVEEMTTFSATTSSIKVFTPKPPVIISAPRPPIKLSSLTVPMSSSSPSPPINIAEPEKADTSNLTPWSPTAENLANSKPLCDSNSAFNAPIFSSVLFKVASKPRETSRISCVPSPPNNWSTLSPPSRLSLPAKPRIILTALSPWSVSL